MPNIHLPKNTRRSITYAWNKMNFCLILAHDCSRDSWDHNQSPAHRREYKRLRHEAMQDARYWRDEIRKNLENRP